MNKSFATFSLSILMALTSSAALAESEAQTPATQQAVPSSSEIPDSTVEKFVQAQQQVESIRGEYMELVQQAEGQQQAMEIQQEAQDKMIQAVEDSGIKVQEYNMIAQVAQHDSGLKKRIKAAQ